MKDVVADRVTLAPLNRVKLGGFLGERVERNRVGRLTHAPLAEFLAGFKERPGAQAWIGEHAGKWLHAASLSWVHGGDDHLKALLDGAVADLIVTQLEDGYLGTYLEKDRWTSWDVWVHKYDLIGLLSYYDATRKEEALSAARRIGDLLVATFSEGKRDIVQAGEHVGMAATSVLEPMVALYRVTGDPRYLELCKALVKSYDQPHGPGIVQSLLSHGDVQRTANAKAYELMSNLVGLCELYRVTGEARLLQAAGKGFESIQSRQLFVTGGTSLGEYFQASPDLPDTGAVAETCANVTWLQLCMHLFRLNGDFRSVDALDRLVFNHLLGAQRSDGEDWCYFTPLSGRKQFSAEINCCHSSGPRALSLLPSLMYGTGVNELYVLLYGESSFAGTVPELGDFEIRQRTDFPFSDKVDVEVRVEDPGRFRLMLHHPRWCGRINVAVDGEDLELTPSQGWLCIDRYWKGAARIALELEVKPKVVAGMDSHLGQVYVQNGPFVLCASSRWNAGLDPRAGLWIDPASALVPAESLPGIDAAENRVLLRARAFRRGVDGVIKETSVILGPFALVQEEWFSVWLKAYDPDRMEPLSLTFGARERGSRAGNVEGSICDDDRSTFRVTYDGTRAEADEWEVCWEAPRKVSRIVFRHGHSFHDGGWFDTAQGKPEVWVRRAPATDWEKAGELSSYPSTQASVAPALEDGQPFEHALDPREISGIRIRGRPACGDDPRQSFSSCAEIQAY